MSASQRAKGQRGERDAARLIYEATGWEVKRRVRQHAGDSDLEGVPNWSVEVKDHATAKLGDVRAWWAQAVRQAEFGIRLPVLIYKRQRGEWRAVWPLSVSLTHQRPEMWEDYAWTVEGSIDAWASVAREIA